MTAFVQYRNDVGIATISMDDGKVNVLSPQMLEELHSAFTLAEEDRAIVVLTGRDGMFSAGFDLKVLAAGGAPARSMLEAGFTLAERIVNFRQPVVAACSGHAIAMGAFLVAAADYRVGIDGEFRIVANEVAAGMVVPSGIIEICRLRLNPSHFHRALALAEPFTGVNAVAAGYFDEVVAQDSVLEQARSRAQSLSQLNNGAYFATKQRTRALATIAIRSGIEEDLANLTIERS